MMLKGCPGPSEPGGGAGGLFKNDIPDNCIIIVYRGAPESRD